MFGTLIALALLSAAEPKSPLSVISERIEAKVGKEIITSTDLQTMIQALTIANKNQKPDGLKQRALETLIERSLMRQYLEKVGYPVADRDLDQRIAGIRANNGAATNDQFRQMLAAQGLTFEQFKDQVRFQMENMQFINVMRRQAQHTIEDKDLRAYYQKNLADFKENFEVELQECVIPLGDNADAAEKKAEAFKKNPKNFDQCVKTLSQSPSASANGKIGKFQSGLLREDIERKVFEIKKDEVAMIQQPGAIQLIKVLEKKNLGPRSFESVKDKIRDHLESDIIQKEIQKTMAEMKATTFIQI